MILAEKDFDSFFYDSFGKDEVSEKFCEVFKELLANYGKQYFRLGVQFTKEQFFSTDCFKIDENTTRCVAELNKRVLNEDDCDKIIEYYIKECEKNDREEELSSKTDDC